MNDLQKARTRAHAHGVIAADMAADGYTKWARFHERKMRQAQRSIIRPIETDEQVRARLNGEFLAGQFEQVS